MLECSKLIKKKKKKTFDDSYVDMNIDLVSIVFILVVPLLYKKLTNRYIRSRKKGRTNSLRFSSQPSNIRPVVCSSKYMFFF